MKKLYIVIPAYNEKDTIREVIEQWYSVVEKIGEDSRLVVVDDGSRDNTYHIMLDSAKNRPQFIPLTKENGGHGATILFAYEYAIKNGADYIFQTDSDGQTDPEEFWQFWRLREDYDMIIGHRNARQDGFSRIIVTKVLKMALKLCFGVKILDANTPFRLMKADTLEKNISLIPKDFNLSNVMISVIYVKKKLKIKFIPITFKPRQGGINSINMKKIMKIGIQALRDFRNINKNLKREGC